MKNYIVAGVVVVATVLGVQFVTNPNVSVTTPPQPTPVVNVSVPEQKAPVVNVPAPVVNTTQPKLGSVTGPDFYGPYVGHNDSRVWVVRQTMRAATTTPCAMRAPTNASTTLMFTGWQITTGTSTAATIDLGTSTTAFSTTTNKVAAKSIASGAQGYVVWTPAGAGVDDNFMSPGTYVVMKTAGAGLSGYTYGGTCTAVFQEF